MEHTDPFDFMIRAKAPRGAHLIMAGDDGAETPLQKTTRFYVAQHGGSIFKNAPPPAGETDGWFKRAPKVSKVDYAAWHAANGNVHNPKIHTQNQSRYGTQRTGIVVGWKAVECNRASSFDWGNLNREYYITEAMKLVDAVR